MGVLTFLGVFFIIIASWWLLEAWDERQKEEEREKDRIESIEKYVLDGYEEILEDAERFGNEFSASLNDFAEKMNKISSLKVDLRPYDVYAVNRLVKDNPSCLFLGRIVIDRNLNPKFMVTAPSLDRTQADIQLNVAYSTDSVKALADTCRKIKMDIDIEKYRKDKVKKAINGK